jgi:uncharacterized protein YjbI with pentapeptide repeats
VISTSVIFVVAGILLVGTLIPGLRLYWPQRRDPVSRTDLGVALLTGALIAFAVLALQILVELRAQNEGIHRQREADRQALLLLLGRQQNLSGLDLHGKDLKDAYLASKVLRGAKLEGADLAGTSLEGANLVEARLVGAKLDKARLNNADLRNADLTGATLVGAKLVDAQLDAASLSPTKDGKTTDLSRADLSNAFVRSDLRGANLTGAILVGTRFAPANLEGADLTGADLQFADLRGANLKGAKLAESKHLDQAIDFSYAMYDGKTTWPQDFSWPDHNGKRPTCAQVTCRFKAIRFTELPPRLRTMRDALRQATHSDCLAGWRLADRPRDVVVVAPRDRATFAVTTTRMDEPKTLAHYVGMSPPGTGVLHIQNIRVGRLRAYAKQFFIVDRAGERNTPLIRIAVYFVEGGQGYKVEGSASPPNFSQFERSFDTLFRVLKVQGHLFRLLRGDRVGCAA